MIRLRHIFRILATFLLLALSPSGADAHAGLLGSTPPAEAILDAPPDEIELRFSEPVRPLSALWRLPDGSQHEMPVEGSGAVISLPPPPDGAAGTYVLAWRVVSNDGHPIAGTLVFSLGAVTGAETGTIMDAGRPAVLAAIILRFMVMLAMTLAVGAACHAVLVGPLRAGAKRLAGAAAIAAPFLAVMAVGAYGLDLLGASAPRLLDSRVWTAALAEPRGWSLPLAAFAALLARAGFSGQRMASYTALLSGAVSLAVSGHAAAGASPIAGQSAMFLHGAALIFWIGGLPPLLMAIGRPEGPARISRFSMIALPAVIVLIGTGIALIMLKSVDLDILLASNWGLLLTAKLLLVATMLLLALQNRFALMPALAGQPAVLPRLRRNIGVEIGLGALVLLMAMGFRLTPPPGASDAPAPAPSAYLRLEGSEASADLMLTPAPPGRVTALLYLGDALGDPLPAQAVALRVETGGDRVKVIMSPGDDGGWHSDGVPLDAPGPWRIEGIADIAPGRQSSFAATLTSPDG